MYAVTAPPSHLSPWIECFWELFPGQLSGWEEHVPADLSTDLVLSLGTSYQHVQSQTCFQVAGTHYHGVRLRPERFLHTQDNHLLGIRFKPGAASHLTPFRGGELCGLLATDDVPLLRFESATNRLVRRLSTLSCSFPLLGSTEVYQELISYLRQIGSARPTTSCVSVALQTIRREGCFRIRELAHSVGVTERTLERHFADHLGVRPKFATRLIRAQMARSALLQGSPPSIVAHSGGFSDQSHLCFEMRSLLGFTPSEETFSPPFCRISPRPPTT